MRLRAASAARQLLQDVDAESRLLDHTADAADLALNPIQTRQNCLLPRLIEHAQNYTPQGDGENVA